MWSWLGTSSQYKDMSVTQRNVTKTDRQVKVSPSTKTMWCKGSSNCFIDDTWTIYYGDA